MDKLCIISNFKSLSIKVNTKIELISFEICLNVGVEEDGPYFCFCPCCSSITARLALKNMFMHPEVNH